MPDNSFLALFLVGLLGGGHCVGMCGGIVGALSLGTAAGSPAQASPVAFSPARGSEAASQPVSAPPQDSRHSPHFTRSPLPSGQASLSLHLAYNAGRIGSYVVAGALAGALGGMSLILAGQLPLRLFLYALSNLMLLALGLYLAGATRSLAFVERLGQSLWRRISPLTRRFLPVRSVAQALPLGMLWGWLPCGLVYSALISALSSGSATRGALSMLAFGLGTLPNLLLAGLLASRLRRWLTRPGVRLLAGSVVATFGLVGLVNLLRAGAYF
ncbi:sulfite exporter TauE/SafE family protein [Rhodocyclus gracilis]|uniref:Sulfite exporter TauE/SafE family protein n=1 Tax=Rhodocyclus tenuis TaxID=1066 RepID=A0A6L5JSU6_RHOTE|nr:sulfite exporter TauE/SafE family protein [Rhodocyclus gracilis]MQY50289.1 sulfite exporter TauE/SafE family protein [Rhodocyclus gracilis]